MKIPLAMLLIRVPSGGYARLSTILHILAHHSSSTADTMKAMHIHTQLNIWTLALMSGMSCKLLSCLL